MFNIRGQAALEFLSTFGGAVFMLAVVTASLSNFGIFSPEGFLPERCTASSGFGCGEFAVFDNGSLDMVLSNEVGGEISMVKLRSLTIGSDVFGPDDVSCLFFDMDGASLNEDGPGRVGAGESFVVNCNGIPSGVLSGSGGKQGVVFDLAYRRVGERLSGSLALDVYADVREGEAVDSDDGDSDNPAPLGAFDCFDSSNVGAIGEAGSGCDGMLIVDNAMLRGASGFEIEHNGNFYTFEDSSRNVFTGQVTDMSELFRDSSSFNSDIGYWDTSSVTNMSSIFWDASSFDGDIDSWNTSFVIDMRSMFRDSAFNQDISGWDVSDVEYMDYMFDGASSFDQDLSGWCVEQLSIQPASFARLTPIENKNGYLPKWGENCNQWWLSDSDLVAHWSFDGITTSSTSIADVSGNGRDLSVTGSMAGVSSDIQGDAIVLDGNGFAELAQSNTVYMQSGSIVGWIKPEFTGDTGHQSNFLFHHTSGADDLLYLALRTGADNSWELGLGNSIRNPRNSENPSGSWTHFALNWDSYAEFTGFGISEYIDYELYSDGGLISSGSLTGSLMDTDNSAWTLASSDINNRHFSGDIDEFMVFNRTLTDSEILAIYDYQNID